MNLVRYCCQYGIMNPQLLERLTAENWLTLTLTPEEVQQFSENHPVDYYRGDSILVKLKTWDSIQLCRRTYQATNTDQLCSNLIATGNFTLAKRVAKEYGLLSSDKIQEGCDTAYAVGHYSEGLRFKIGNEKEEFVVDTVNEPLRFRHLRQFIDADGQLIRSAYQTAGATSVKLIRELTNDYVIKLKYQFALLLSALSAGNLDLSLYLVDLLQARGLTLTNHTTDVQRQILLDVSVLGNLELYEKILKFVDLAKIRIAVTPGSRAIAEKYGVTDPEDALVTAGYFGELDLLEYILTEYQTYSDEEDFENEPRNVLSYFAYGAAAAGSGSLLLVILSLMNHFESLNSSEDLIKDYFELILEVAFRFQNWNCMAIVIRLGYAYNIRKWTGYISLPYVANKKLPELPNEPAWYDAWVDSFYENSV